jgi:Complex 1 protein (LYR family)
MVDSVEILHAYRRLLRAATYLPDSFAQNYAHNRILERFRRNSRRGDSKPITSGRIRKAISSAKSLERAGNGSLEDLQKVLLLTYGRTGSRRRELIQALLRPDENIFPKDDLALKMLIENPTGEEAGKHKPNPKLTAFVESQESNHPLESVKPKIKKLKIPKENIWGRAIPQRAELNMRKKWWAITLDRLLPPVPQHEWERLRDLALGKIPLDEVPKRRSRKEERVEGQEEEMRVLRYLQHCLKAKEAEIEEVAFDPERGLVARTRDRKETDQLKDRTLINSTRVLRRLYGSIWSITPTMSQDEVTKKWNIQWGPGRSLFLSGSITKPSASDLELFEGIESQPQPELPPKPARTPQKPKQNRQEARLSGKSFIPDPI